ncbi:DUF2336 domain-containing protein [Salinarimonas ramus]|uniref:DUF2336 domain-containing protein n=1 Tax=Salinarimonas ramus TaxID=690164 RepID=A0A917Q926_9HYPH|nr:DUF2336 domain-containing protein [Salinarimonas ramus]GGK36287.1 hypothetical protein GCM10011322_24110 [Salinarimonas ramus]
MTPPPPPLDEDIARLSALARDGGAVAPVLLRVQADLFAASRRREEEADAFAELAIRLLPKADSDVAAHVARRVVALPETPPAVLQALAAHGGEAGRLVAALAPDLPVATDRTEPLVALARARRGDLAPSEIAALVARDDPAIDRALAENADLALGGRALADLVARARAVTPLARALLARDDLPADDAAGLYPHADEPMRTRLLVRLSAAPRADTRPAMRPRPSPETIEALLAAADRGDRALFGSALAAALGLETRPDWRFDRPERHDLLAHALRASGLGEEETIRIFLTLDPGIARSVEIVFRLVGLVRGVPRSVATRIVEAVYGVRVGARRPAAATYIPTLAPDSTHRPRFTQVLQPRSDKLDRKNGRAT